MRVALISDLHGNALALEAVLAEVSRGGTDRVVCLGDVATLGPEPARTMARLRELECDTIAGNHDAFLLEPESLRSYTEAPQVIEAVEWCREQLDEEDLAFVRTFVPTVEVALGGGMTLLSCHGSPRSHTEDVLAIN